jgi:hypothetical protein
LPRRTVPVARGSYILCRSAWESPFLIYHNIRYPTFDPACSAGLRSAVVNEARAGSRAPVFDRASSGPLLALVLRRLDPRNLPDVGQGGAVLRVVKLALAENGFKRGGMGRAIIKPGVLDAVGEMRPAVQCRALGDRRAAYPCALIHTAKRFRHPWLVGHAGYVGARAARPASM